MKKRICILAVVLLFALTFSGCSKKGYDASFVYDIDANPTTLDPQLASDSASLAVVANVFEGLMAYDTQGEVICGAAESYKISDGKTRYTFTLRQDATYSDGKTKITAADFEYAFYRLLSPNTQSPYAEEFFNIQGAQSYYQTGSGTIGVQADGDNTLIIQLNQPDENFLSKLALPATAPCNQQFFEGTKGTYGLSVDTLLCNGSFYVSYWDDTDNYYLTLKRNQHYQGEHDVAPASVVLNIYQEQEDQQQNFEDQASDCILQTDPATAAECDDISLNRSVCLLLNPNALFLRIDSVAKALYQAADTDCFKDLLPKGYYLSDSIVPDGALVGNSAYKDLTDYTAPAHDATAAAQNYAQGLAYYKNTSSAATAPTLSILCTKEQEQFLTHIMQLWQRDLSFYTTLNVVEQEELDTAIASGDYQIAVLDMYSATGNAADYLSYFDSQSSSALGGFSLPSLSAQLSIAAGNTDDAAAAAAIATAEKVATETYRVIPLYCTGQALMMQEGVSDIAFNRVLGCPLFYAAKKDD